MGLLPERLPAALSERLASSSAAIYSRQGREYDVAIGGIPFLLANYSDNPKLVETIPVRKDQFDTERDPGEQSLSSWWRRSQASFHEGAGALYAEDNDGNATNGYWDSEGIDPFTQGQIRLLKRMDKTSVGGDIWSRLRSAGSGVSTGINNGTYFTGSVYHSVVGKTLVDGLTSGTTFYDVDSVGNLYTGTKAGGTTTSSWPLASATTVRRLAWGKYRLWVIGGRSIWQPDVTTASGTSQSAIYTHPSSGWTYTCMAESPTSMLFGGNDGFSSSIQAVTLDANGGLPTLSGATVVATLPDGELVQEIAVLAGTYVGIGTSQGFRIGVMDGNGSIAYGPLIVSPDNVTACTALTAQGRFFVVAFSTSDNRPLAYRIDTATQVSDGVFAYAKDIDCGGTIGAITSLAPLDSDRLVASVADGSAWSQSTTNYVTSGYFQSGRIRYRTNENKAFKFLSLEIEPLHGTVSASMVLPGGSDLTLGSINTQGEVFEDAFRIQYQPTRHMSVKLTLLAGDSGASTPVVNSYLVKALPAVAPQRMITLPLLCFDREKAVSGQQYGAVGWANDRLAALQILEDAAEAVVFQDFSTSASSGQIVTIESIRFVQNSPPRPNSPDQIGGLLVVQLRTVAG